MGIKTYQEKNTKPMKKLELNRAYQLRKKATRKYNFSSICIFAVFEMKVSLSFVLRGCVCTPATLATASEEDSDNTGIHTNPSSTERMLMRMMMGMTIFVGAQIMCMNEFPKVGPLRKNQFCKLASVTFIGVIVFEGW